LGVYADLSQDGNNEEHTDHEGVKLEIVFEMQDEEENCVSGIDEHDNSAKKEKRMGTDMNHNRRNSVHEDDAGYSEEILARPEINKDNVEIGGQKHDRNYSVKTCKINAQKLRKFHGKTYHADKNYEKEKLRKCRVCHYSASTPSALNIHMRNHTGEKPYTCAICSSAFSQKQHLKQHMSRHTGEKPFTCAICSSAFIQKNCLVRHMRMHTGEKPYTCAICSSAFSLKCGLGRHMRRHTGERPYTCAICSPAFSQKHHLKVHMRTHE